MKFSYVLQAFFEDEVLEKFFGQKRQRIGDNCYIDFRNITAAANLHNLLKSDLLPVGNN